MRDMIDNRKNAPVSLAEALLKVISDLGLDVRINEERLKFLWPEIVGGKLSKVSHVVKVNRGRLLVSVRSSSWRNEMIFLKKDIVKRINRFFGRDVVRDISFVLGEEVRKNGR